jgi:hypothetical protein
MKKGSKSGECTYEVTITDLAFKIPINAESNSLRELVRLIQAHVPSMATYSKVYREMRENLGVFISLFTMPLPGKKVRQVVVHITSNNITEADIERFHAHAATLPTLPEGTSFEDYIKGQSK